MERETLTDLLARHPFFAGLERDLLAFIAGCGRNAAFREGEYLAREGEPADAFYVLRHGRVALELHTPERGTVVLLTLGPGEVLGWSWLLPPHRWRFDARALEPVRAVALDGACLRQKCEEDPRLGYRLLRRLAGTLVDRLIQARLQSADLYAPPGRRG